MSTTYPLSVAPMIDWTDRHCRYFHRQLSNEALLYTEMVTTGAILYGKQDYLAYSAAEQPVALQLGGSDPEALATCAGQAAERGYREINLNVGCPSDRVQNGRFGACLMAEPSLVGQCLTAMQRAAPAVPVTIKTRLGIDEQDSYAFLRALLDEVAAAGCGKVILHARKAWLQGLSPKENRDIPPLDYDRVYQVKTDYANRLSVHLNGGVQSLTEASRHLEHVDGVMIGRAFYQHPWLLTGVDELVRRGQMSAGQELDLSARAAVVHRMLPYIDQHIQQGGRFWHVARHMLGLFQQCPGARMWRRHLSENGPRATSSEPLLTALNIVSEAVQAAESKTA